jgi:6-pyruvoyltetrahydropterin/6-carboxytetrahydropterin synthase
MVVDLNQLDAILQEEIFERFDHRHINYDIAEFEYGKRIPTVEALAVHIWKSVKRRLPSDVDLECVRVQEEPSLYAEYRGEA